MVWSMDNQQSSTPLHNTLTKAVCFAGLFTVAACAVIDRDLAAHLAAEQDFHSVDQLYLQCPTNCFYYGNGLFCELE